MFFCKAEVGEMIFFLSFQWPMPFYHGLLTFLSEKDVQVVGQRRYSNAKTGRYI